MKKTLFIILALCSMSYGLSGYSLYKTYVAKDTVTHINLDSNFYRGVNWSNKLADTIDRNFIRWYDFNSHDSTLRYFKVDTIRSNPNVDSITGDITITGSPTITGALTSTTLNTGNGANELYAMDQPVRTTDAVNFDSIVLSKGLKLGTGATGPTSTPYKIDLGNTFSNGETADRCKIYLYNDGSGYYGFGVGTNTDVQYHAKNVNGSHRFYVNDVEKFRVDNNSQNVRTNDAVTFATVNTGNGANELYAMDQNVRTTDAVTFDSTRTRVSVFDSVKLGSGSYLKTYVEGSFPCTLKTSDVTVQQTGIIKYTIIGNTVTLTFPFIYGTSNSTTLRLYCGGLTGALDPGSSFSSFSTVVDNATSYSGSVVYTHGLGNYFLFRKYDGSDFTGSGSKGIGHWLYTSKVTIQYTK